MRRTSLGSTVYSRVDDIEVVVSSIRVAWVTDCESSCGNSSHKDPLATVSYIKDNSAIITEVSSDVRNRSSLSYKIEA